MTVIIHDPGNELPAERYYVFLSVDPDGTEGIVAASSDLGMMPLTTIDEKKLPAMREWAKSLRRMTGKKIVIGFFKRERTEAL